MIAYLVGIILPVEAFGGMEIRAKRNLALAKKDNMGKFTTKSQYSKEEKHACTPSRICIVYKFRQININ